jgi:hypothetical protein
MEQAFVALETKHVAVPQQMAQGSLSVYKTGIDKRLKTL